LWVPPPPRFATWLGARAIRGDVHHLRTTADASRVVVEHVIGVRDGLVLSGARVYDSVIPP
jgi:hypothetical protein